MTVSIRDLDGDMTRLYYHFFDREIISIEFLEEMFSFLSNKFYIIKRFHKVNNGTYKMWWDALFTAHASRGTFIL